MKCLMCLNDLKVEWDFVNIFKSREPLCEMCKEELLLKTEGTRCEHCHTIINGECKNCVWLHKHFKKVDKIHYVTEYNNSVQSLFHRYKFVNDASMAQVLSIITEFNFKNYDLVVPIPISKARLNERGYNQTTLVLKYLKVPYVELFTTNKVKRQSELSKHERLNNTAFELKTDVNLSKKNILIVDDIYTTGITVHQAAKILYEQNSKHIEVLTFSKV